MNILAFDTATPICSIGLASEKGTWYVEIDAGQRHSESFMDAADMLMNLGGLQPDDLDGVACMKGPGSFTGLRVGFSAAKGIGLALGIPLLTVPTLDCLVLSGSGFPGLVAPVIDAKQHCYFTALYRGAERLTDYLDADARSIAELLQGTDRILLTGLDADLLYSELKGIPSLKDRLQLDPSRRKGGARELLALVKLRLTKPDGIETEIFTGPLYLRKSDAELQELKQNLQYI